MHIFLAICVFLYVFFGWIFTIYSDDARQGFGASFLIVGTTFLIGFGIYLL